MRTWCSVIRDGRHCTIPAEQLVVGDLLFIRSGVHVLADVRLLFCNGLKLDTTCFITGETESIELTDEIAAGDVTALDGRNIAFRGSFCVDGDGLGVVIRVAGNTLIDRLMSQQIVEHKRKISWRSEVVKPIRFIILLALTLATVMSLWDAYMSNFNNMLGIFVNGFVVVIVANVPQGLPTTLLCQLSIAARRMARKNVLLKNVDVMEALGATTVIVSDMAGALTTNSRTVARLWCNKQYFSGRPDLQQQELAVEELESPLLELLAVMTVCNRRSTAILTTGLAQCDNSCLVDCIPPSATLLDAELGGLCKQSAMPPDSPTSKVAWRTGNVCGGNPTEFALLQYASQLVDVNKMRSRFEIVFEISFNSVRRWQLIIAKLADKASVNGMAMFTLMITGHPESLIELCSTLACESGAQRLDRNRRIDLKSVYLQLGDEGHGVIGFASKTFAAAGDTRFSADAGNYPQSEYCFLGMAAIMGEPREDFAEAIQECQDAGIKVFMITGDDVATARAVARKIGVIGHHETTQVQCKEQQQCQTFVIDEDETNCAIVDSDSLAALTTHQWDDLLQKQNVVFASATSEHKLLIVEECQRRREIVAVTGANCSDAPSLQRGDIGFAIGSSDCQLAKQVADIIVVDDKFSSIVAGIQESRLMYDRLKKATAFTLTHLWPEIFAIVINLALGFPRGLSILQILSIDLCSDLLSAISLAWETKERDLMKKPARKRGAHLVSWNVLLYSYALAGSIIAAGCFAAYLSVFWHYGISTSDLSFSWVASAKNFSSNGLVFSASDQQRVVAEASAAWHITLVMSQVFHLWMCTTRRASIFHHGITNLVGVLACVVNVLLICFLVFTPGVQSVIGTSAPPYHAWYFSAVVGAALLVFNESRKVLIRYWPRSNFVKLLEW